MDELTFGVFIVLAIVIGSFHSSISALISALAERIRSKYERNDYLKGFADGIKHADPMRIEQEKKR